MVDFLRKSFSRILKTDSTTDSADRLQHAHDLLVVGKYAQAANLFDELARSAEKKQALRAPFLHIQAGRARLLLGENSRAAVSLKHGLALLLHARRFTRFYKFGIRAVEDLRARGLENESREIQAMIQSNMPAVSEMPTERVPDLTKVSLPPMCNSCHGPLRIEEVEWMDMRLAECPYCGAANIVGE